MASASSLVRSRSATPRMSYSRKTWGADRSMVNAHVQRFGPIRKRLSAIVARAVDSTPPRPPPPSPAPVPAPSAYVYAATDERPRTPHEIELCKKASSTDWVYFLSGLVLTAGSIVLYT